MRLCEKDRHVDMSLPADKDMMLLVRLTASGILARTGVTIDALDDFKMAVEEACSLLIAKAAENGRIRFRYDMVEDGVRFECSYEDGCANVVTDISEIEFAKAILDSLVNEARVNMAPDGTINSIALKIATGAHL